MTDRNAQFTGSIPAVYDRFLGPMLFEPFADDLTARLTVPPTAAVLELACGTGILTKRLRRALPAKATLTATDLNEPMAENPFGRIARDTIARYFTSDPPTFYEVPFGFHDEPYIRALLHAAHLAVVSCDRVVLEARSPSAGDAARGLVTGNPIVLDIGERATAPPEEIIDAVAAALAAEGGAAPLHLPMRALVCVARAV